jgi:hypothetical protein
VCGERGNSNHAIPQYPTLHLPTGIEYWRPLHVVSSLPQHKTASKANLHHIPKLQALDHDCHNNDTPHSLLLPPRPRHRRRKSQHRSPKCGTGWLFDSNADDDLKIDQCLQVTNNTHTAYLDKGCLCYFYSWVMALLNKENTYRRQLQGLHLWPRLHGHC